MSTRDAQENDYLNSDAISDDYFISIVEKKLKIKRDEFKLRLVLLSPAVGKNENYNSVLYRAKIKIEMNETKERKVVDVIIKALLSTAPEMKQFSVFPRERLMYDDVLKSFEEIWLQAGEEIKFGPRMIKSETDPYEQIIMDDLKQEGFSMNDRRVGLNMIETKMVLSKLAKFHAASVIRYQKDGIIQTCLDKTASMPPLSPDSPMIFMFQTLFNGFVESVKSYEGCEVYAEKIGRWDMMNFLMAFMTCSTPTSGGFQVLNHGDMWINNAMFRRDAEGNPIEVSLIDYQMSFWASPTADLLYFLITSVADDIKVEHFDDFIAFYHKELTDDLKKLKYDEKKVLTLAELHVDIIEKGAFTGICLATTLCGAKYDSTEEFSMELVMSGKTNIDLMYKNDNYKKALKLWLAFLDKRGFLDLLVKKEVVAKEE